MNAIVSLLDEAHAARAAALWDELARRLRISTLAQTPFAHLSYLVAPDCDDDDLIPLLERVAARHAPLMVSTSGFGVFNLPIPVVYLTVCRSAALTSLHQSVWAELVVECDEVMAHYEPNRWIPHITLAHNVTDRPTLAAAVALLAEHDLRWTLPLENLALIRIREGKAELRARVELTGPTAPPAA